MTALEPASWIRARSGLARSLHTLGGGPAPIAYLGLSVTAQREGFRPRLHDLLVQRTGHPHPAIHGGIGGVGSVSLTFLMDRLVIEHRPALCFIECTTGDIAGDERTPLDEVPKSIEGIIRKLNAIGCQPCVLHLYRGEVVWNSDHPVVAAYERIADHYGVPSINIGRRLDDDFVRGRANVDSLFRDVVHTTPLGAQVTADLIGEGITYIQQHGGIDGPRESMGSRPRLTDGVYHCARLMPVDAADCDGPPQIGRFRLTYPYVGIHSPNALRLLEPTATLKGLFVIVGPSSGSIHVSTPVGDREYVLKDQWSHYDRISTVIFERPIPAGSPVVIRPLEASTLRVIGLLCLPS